MFTKVSHSYLNHQDKNPLEEIRNEEVEIKPKKEPKQTLKNLSKLTLFTHSQYTHIQMLTALFYCRPGGSIVSYQALNRTLLKLNSQEAELLMGPY